jgi:hypothetical protein
MSDDKTTEDAVLPGRVFLCQGWQAYQPHPIAPRPLVDDDNGDSGIPGGSRADILAGSVDAMTAGPAIGIVLPKQGSSPFLDWKSEECRCRAISKSIRDRAELPPETGEALQQLVDVIRAIEGHLSALEGKRPLTAQTR